MINIIRYRAGNDAVTTAKLTPARLNYINKLSHAAPVEIWFEDGSYKKIECGHTVKHLRTLESFQSEVR